MPAHSASSNENTAADVPADALIAALQAQLSARLIETHISWVLLDGRFAWKIKKPVRLAFLDASTLATREHLCHEELRLNRRLAPSIYLSVVKITGSPESPQMDGAGPAIEFAVRMRQFEAGALLSERVQAGTVQLIEMDHLAQRLAGFHRQAAVASPDAPFGTPELIEGAASKVVEELSRFESVASLAGLRTWLSEQALALRTTWLQRKAEGRVVEGHGDLHLANVVMLDGELTGFDCIEFDPALRWLDVQSDVAFLMMDLLAHGRSDLAWRFINAYLDDSGDHAGLATLRYYLVYRSLVRALVMRLQIAQGGKLNAPNYLTLARRLAASTDARLMITHGVSGSGKSVASQGLIEHAQAIRIRADVERKRLAGLAAHADSTGVVPGGIYSADFNQRTYDVLLKKTRHALQNGWRVIVDATFIGRPARDGFRQLARELGVPFTILHCEAPLDTLRERVQQRRERGGDASEADLSVLTSQLENYKPLQADELACTITLDVSHPEPIDVIASRWLAFAQRWLAFAQE